MGGNKKWIVQSSQNKVISLYVIFLKFLCHHHKTEFYARGTYWGRSYVCNLKIKSEFKKKSVNACQSGKKLYQPLHFASNRINQHGNWIGFVLLKEHVFIQILSVLETVWIWNVF